MNSAYPAASWTPGDSSAGVLQNATPRLGATLARVPWWVAAVRDALRFVRWHGLLPWLCRAAPGRHAAGRTGLTPYRATRRRSVRRGDNLYHPLAVFALAGVTARKDSPSMFVLNTIRTQVAYLRNGDMFAEEHPILGKPKVYRLFEAVPSIDGTQLALVVDRLDGDIWYGRNFLVRDADDMVDRINGIRTATTAAEELVAAEREIREAQSLCVCHPSGNPTGGHGLFCPLYVRQHTPAYVSPAVDVPLTPRHAAPEPLEPAIFCADCGLKLPDHTYACTRRNDVPMIRATGEEPEDPREWAGDDEEQIQAAARTERYAAEEAAAKPEPAALGYSAGGLTDGRRNALAEATAAGAPPDWGYER